MYRMGLPTLSEICFRIKQSTIRSELAKYRFWMDGKQYLCSKSPGERRNSGHIDTFSSGSKPNWKGPPLDQRRLVPNGLRSCLASRTLKQNRGPAPALTNEDHEDQNI